MRNIDKNIWVAETEFKLLGAHLGNRMTVIRLSSGDLLLHSPIKMDSEIAASVKRLGAVAYIITPDNFHGLFVEEWRAEFPQAKYFTAKKMEETSNASFPLSALGHDELNAEIEVIKIEGAPKVNEYALIHKKSKTLILTDIAFNIGGNIPLWSRLFFKMNRAFNKFGPSRLMKTMIADPKALELSVEKILAFDLARVIVLHGDILESNANAAMRDAFCRGVVIAPRKSTARFSLARCG